MLADTVRSLGVAGSGPGRGHARRRQRLGNGGQQGGGQERQLVPRPGKGAALRAHQADRAAQGRAAPYRRRPGTGTSARRITIPSRAKEAELDYRYFLEGDIPWVALDPDTVRGIRESMPESVLSRQGRYVGYGMSPPGGRPRLAADPLCHALFEEAHTAETARLVANLITTDFMGVMDNPREAGVRPGWMRSTWPPWRAPSPTAG